jgi:AhpD family alkylhydroperoxidase
MKIIILVKKMKLDDKTFKLIGLGASIAANCQPCTRYHIKAARDAGITNEEIDEAISIAAAVKKNASKFLADYSKKLLNSETTLEETKETDSEPVCCPGSSKSNRSSSSDTTCCSG